MSGYGSGSGTRAPRILASDPMGHVVSPGDCPIVLRALAIGKRELGESGRIREAVAEVNNRANRFCVDECNHEKCRLFSMG